MYLYIYFKYIKIQTIQERGKVLPLNPQYIF